MLFLISSKFNIENKKDFKFEFSLVKAVILHEITHSNL